MSLTMTGKKRGMLRLFDKETGKSTPCTVIELSPNVVSQIKTIEKDGYSAVQMAALACSSVERKRMKKPLAGHFESKKIDPHKKLKESKVDDLAGLEVGKVFGVDYFEEVIYVDVQGISKGKGYQGVIKRFGVASIAKSHGAGPVVRHIGSSGSMTSHGRVHKGKKASGQMGNASVVAENLQVVEINTNLNALIVKGAIPGANGDTVYVRKAIKRKG